MDKLKMPVNKVQTLLQSSEKGAGDNESGPEW